MNDELNRKMRDAMKEQFSWAKDLPLTKEIARIMKESGGSALDKLKAAWECCMAAKKSILPHVETTEITNVFIVAALESIAGDIRKKLDPQECGAADEMAGLISLSPATVIATYAKRSEIFDDDKK